MDGMGLMLILGNKVKTIAIPGRFSIKRTAKVAKNAKNEKP